MKNSQNLEIFLKLTFCTSKMELQLKTDSENWLVFEKMFGVHIFNQTLHGQSFKTS